MTEQRRDDNDDVIDGVTRSMGTRRKIAITLSIYYGYAVAAVFVYIIGPSAVSFEIIFQTTTSKIAGAFTGLSAGYLCGAVICGSIYNKFNKNAIQIVSMILASAAMLGLALSINIIMFIGATTLLGVFLGIVDTVCNSYNVNLWKNHRFLPAIVQGIYCVYSVGSTIGPFLLHPFLANIHYTPNITNVDYYNASEEVSTRSWEQTFTTGAEDEDLLIERVSSVRTGVLLTVGVGLSSTLFFFVMFLITGTNCLEKATEVNEPEKHQSMTPPIKFRIALLTFVTLFYTFYQIMELCPGLFLATFVLKGLGWENNQGSLITSTYFGAITVGRVLGIPLSMHVKARDMVIGSLVLTNLGFILMLFAARHYSIMWIACAVAGLGLSTMKASVLLVIEKMIKFTGKVAAGVTAATSFGAIVAPLLAGFLIEIFSYMVMVYICLVSSICSILVCIGIFLLRKTQIKDRNNCGNVAQSDNGPVELRAVDLQTR